MRNLSCCILGTPNHYRCTPRLHHGLSGRRCFFDRPDLGTIFAHRGHFLSGLRQPLVLHTCCIRFAKRSCHCGISDSPNRHLYDCWNDRFAQSVHRDLHGLGIHGHWSDHGRWSVRHRCPLLHRIGCILVGKRSCCCCTLDNPNRHHCWNDRFAQSVHRDLHGLGIHGHWSDHGRWSVRHRCPLLHRIGCILVGKRSCCCCTLDNPNRHRCWNGRFGRFAQIGRHGRFGLGLDGRCFEHRLGLQCFVLHEPSLDGC